MKREEELNQKAVRDRSLASRRVKNRQIHQEGYANKETVKSEIPNQNKESKTSNDVAKKVTTGSKTENTAKTATQQKETNKQTSQKIARPKTKVVTEKKVSNSADDLEATKVYIAPNKTQANKKKTTAKTTSPKVIKVAPQEKESFFESLKKKRQANKAKKEEERRYNEIQKGRPNDGSSGPKGSRGVFISAVVVWTIIGIGIIGVIICGIIGFKLLEGMPELVLTDLVAEESSVIYDANDQVVAELGEYKRENVGYEEMPNVLVDAFLSIEDSRFFEHFGFDIPRFTKAFLENIKSGSFDQGGSTFTMQLIKNTYFQIDDGANSTLAERSIQRKAQEIILAIEADAKLDKRDIFASYLNRINFGNNIRGIQKASQYYFGKDVSELDLSDSAFLAGLINSPNACNPYNNLIKYDEGNIYVSADIDYLENGTQRRNEVLDMMVYHGYITEEECALAKAVKLEDRLVGESSVFNDVIPYYQSYIDAVIDEVTEVTGLDPTTNSMKIYTNMDTYMQQLVYDIQNSNDIIDWYRDDMQNAIISMNNQTGAIVAIGGGRNQSGALNWNRATMSKIQPGSTIKPVFEYLLAFEDLGWSTAHTVTDRPIYLYGSDHLIGNATGTYDGDMLVTEAVDRSLNTPAIQTLQAIIDEKGEQYCVDFLNSIGIDADLDTFDLQYAIGGNTLQVSPKQLAGAHAVLFNGGKYIEPHTVRYIELPDGTTYTADTEGERVVSEGAAYLAAYLEEDVVSGNWYNYTQILKDSYPVYAKTGTTDWGDSGTAYGIPVGSAKDSWLVCSTNQYTNVIWLGFDRAAEGTYITSRDDNINIKGQIGNILLDEGISHFGYEAKAIERPSDVTEITHVKGLFPYIEPTVGEPVTGLILKKYNRLLPESEIEYEIRTGTLSDIDVSVSNDDTINVDFVILGEGAGEGIQDLTATSLSGKVTRAYGRLYYPRIRYVMPDDVTYSAELRIDGTLVDSISTSDTSTSFDVYRSDLIGANEVEVCGSSSSSSEQFCKVIDISEFDSDTSEDFPPSGFFD